MPWEELTPSLFQGILMGSLFVLMAVGLTLTYAVSRVINFAHGELVTLGAYAAALAVNLSGLSLLPALVLGAAAGALAALTLDELIYKPLMARRASPSTCWSPPLAPPSSSGTSSTWRPTPAAGSTSKPG